MSEPRARLVVNPRASRVTPATRDLIVHALASVTKLEVAETEHAGHARSLAADASDDGYDLVVAMGGDGTVNEVANGILDGGRSTTLAVIPSGGADVFARTIGLPRNTIEAADAVVQAIEHGTRPQRRAVAWLDTRAWLFNAGVGFDAAIVEAVDRHPSRKRRYGDFYFVAQTLKVFFGRYRRQRHRVHASCRLVDGSTIEVAGSLTVACLSDPYTFLGSRGLRLCPDARADVGMSMLVVDRLTTPRTLRIMARAFGRARHGRIRDVTVIDGVVAAEIRTEPPVPIQTDGELGPSHVTTATLRYHADALSVLVPQLP